MFYQPFHKNARSETATDCGSKTATEQCSTILVQPLINSARMEVHELEGAVLIGLLGLIRVVTLTSERIALHGLGRANRGALATMGIGFGGAAVVLWFMSFLEGQPVWMPSTLWSGFIYALAFGFYTASLAKGPLGVVSPWSNATVVILWCVEPSSHLASWAGVALFAIGAGLLTSKGLTTPVIWMLLSDVLLASARFIDVNHVSQAPIAYAASLFTVITFWMFVPIILFGKLGEVWRLTRLEPGWSFIAATSNAGAYITLFILLRWIHPAAVEAISALASGVATLSGILFFRETQGKRKVISAVLMTAGSILLLYRI